VRTQIGKKQEFKNPIVISLISAFFEWILSRKQMEKKKNEKFCKKDLHFHWV
jgi:hypothetical protein